MSGGWAASARDVIAQRFGFPLDLFDLEFDHITDGNDADQPAIFGDWHMSNAAARHAFHNLGNWCHAIAGDHITRHAGADGEAKC